MPENNLEQQNISETPDIITEDITVEIADDESPSRKPQQAQPKDSLSEEEIEARRLKRKNDNKERQQRQRAARQRSEEELAELRAEREAQHNELRRMKQELQQLKGVATQYQTQTITKDIVESERVLQYYDQQLELAVSNADGAKMLQILKARDEERGKLNQLKNAQEQARKFDTQGHNNLTPQDEFLLQQQERYTNDFVREHKWFKDPRYAEEAEITKRIDAEVAAEGYNAGTKAYWNELRKRMRDELDYMFDDDLPPPSKTEPSRNVVGASVSNPSASSSAPGTISLKFAADKVPVLKRIGVLDDNGKIIDKKRALYYHNAWNKKG